MVKYMASKEELKRILKELKSEENLASIEEKARLLLRDVDPETLSLVEQELMAEGFDPEEFRRLCEIHLKAITIRREDNEVGRDHPVSILKAEHEVILDNLKSLEKIVGKLRFNIGLGQLSEELKKLEPILELLLEAESHHQREEKSLFPRLEERGVTGPPNIMRLEHEDLRARKRALKKLLDERNALDYNYLVNRVRELGMYIALTLRDHIYKENNILYPLALKTIPENEWDGIREEFDAIGYCCFTPEIKVQSRHRH
jgi:DUF438 domain-containing protein